MKVKSLVASVVCLTAISACGGSKSNDSSQSALLGACDPASALAGTSVTCPVSKDVTGDCTFFFAGHPTDFVLDEEKGAFSFTVPTAISGTQEMSFQCGDGDPLSAGTFDVIAPASGDESPSNGDQEITPTGTAGEGTGGTTTGDGTTGGTTGGETTGAETQATTTAASINSFTVTPVTDSSAHLNTFQISYSYTNAKAAYIWGNMLNRNSWDATLDASESCKLQTGRYLVTNSDGTDLVSGSDNYTKWQYLSEGTRCDDSTECLSQSTSTTTATTASAHLMFAQPMAVAAPAVQMPVLQASPTETTSTETSTNCRVDLNQADGTLVASDSFYTHSLVQYGSLCLAVQGTDDTWQVQCLSGDSLNAKAVDLDGEDAVTISPSTTKLAFDMNLKAVNTTAIQVYCTQDDDDIAGMIFSIDQFSGAAYYSGTCDVNSETQSVTVRIYGVGDYNVKVKTYTLAMDAPDVKLKLDGDAPASNQASKIDLAYSATRHYTITDEVGTVVSEGDAAWLKQRKFTGFKNAQDKDYLDGNKHDITSPGQLDGKITNIQVSHDYSKWTYKVYDFDGNKYEDSYTLKNDTFATSSTLTKIDSSSGYGYGYGGEGSHSCDKAKDLNMWADYDWTAQNVGVVDDETSDANGKSIFVVDGDCTLTGDQPDPSKYDSQSGTVHINMDFGKENGTYDIIKSCTIRFVYWDDSWSDKTITNEFNCKKNND